MLRLIINKHPHFILDCQSLRHFIRISIVLQHAHLAFASSIIQQTKYRYGTGLECKLHLDDPVDKWLPELANRQVLKRPDGPLDETVPARRPITVRDLLTSTFGLGMDLSLMGSPIQNAIFEAGIYDTPQVEMPEPDEWMRRLGTLPLSYQPGERRQYHVSNEVLGVLVARVTGQTFETFLRERVLDPLGMKDTGFYVPEGKIDRLPPAYIPDPQTGEFIVWDEAAGDATVNLRRFKQAAVGCSQPSTTITLFYGCC